MHYAQEVNNLNTMLIKTPVSRRYALRSALGLAAPAALPAHASSFVGPHYEPERPLHIVVPFAPGGRTGSFARRLVVALDEVLGETVVLEHRIGTPDSELTKFADAPADSRELLLAEIRLPRRGVFKQEAISSLINSFIPIALVARDPMVLLVSERLAVKLRINNADQLLRYARRYPGKLTIASGADGSTCDLAAELLKSMSQTYITRMPAADLTPDYQAVIDGRIDLVFASLHAASYSVATGQLRALGLTAGAQFELPGLKNLRALRPIPLMQATPGLEGYEIYDFHTLFASPSTPPDTVELLRTTCAKALALPSIRGFILDSYAIPGTENAAQFLAIEDEEEKRWRRARGRW
jgi:tripartite-type tricarboxylate transporter receptor subunit TctC